MRGPCTKTQPTSFSTRPPRRRPGNALDARNEEVIIDNLSHFFKNRTVVVVAHRLSTVRHADQIVVLDRGVITEIGTHEELTAQRGEYWSLVKNQLALGA